jgi:hypothetical protein
VSIADDTVVYLFLRAATDASDFASGHRVPLVLDLISDQSSCTFNAKSNSYQRALLFTQIRSQLGSTEAATDAHSSSITSGGWLVVLTLAAAAAAFLAAFAWKSQQAEQHAVPDSTTVADTVPERRPAGSEGTGSRAQSPATALLPAASSIARKEADSAHNEERPSHSQAVEAKSSGPYPALLAPSASSWPPDALARAVSYANL